MTFDQASLRQLIQDVDASELTHFALQTEDLSLVLSKQEAPMSVAGTPSPMVTETPVVALGQTPSVPEAPVTAGTPTTGTAVKAPLVGVVYLKPNPEAAPFVQIGDQVAAGDQVAVIEAMKLMTPIYAEEAGVVATIPVTDGALVGFDDVILTLA